ncbi:MAG: DUF3047 domain-containing protein [Bacteroidota bacterium]
MRVLLRVLPVAPVLTVLTLLATSDVEAQSRLVLEDFETYRVNDIPTGWSQTRGRNLVPLEKSHMAPDEYFVVQNEGGNQFVRARVEKQAQKIVLPMTATREWSLEDYPSLEWRWRARELPAGSDERKSKTNDSGAALYVTFGYSFFGRPQSIKYVYSESLPVGTVAEYGSLKVLVVSSGNDGIGSWRTVKRNVVDDYRRLFGKEPPANAEAITLWSDADTVNGTAEADFDDIVALGG